MWCSISWGEARGSAMPSSVCKFSPSTEDCFASEDLVGLLTVIESGGQPVHHVLTETPRLWGGEGGGVLQSNLEKFASALQ